MFRLHLIRRVAAVFGVLGISSAAGACHDPTEARPSVTATQLPDASSELRLRSQGNVSPERTQQAHYDLIRKELGFPQRLDDSEQQIQYRAIRAKLGFAEN